MDAKLNDFLEQLAEHLVVDEWDEVAEMLAPWLYESASDLRRQVREQAKATREDWEDADIGPADSFDIDDSALGLDQLRKEGIKLPREVTPANFKAWCRVTVQADEGEWSLYDLWCAVVEDEGSLVVGYFDVESPD